jgi:1,4-dihydroxy-2-naphthoate octaprenyltransferase
MLNFIVWVVLLAALLFWPMSKLIWVLSVRRLQRKLERELEENELAGQMKRARVISAFVSVLFSFLYNLQTLGMPGRE